MVRKKFVRKGQYWVYIVQCSDGTYYTGYTNNLEERVARHNKGFASKYTSRRRPVKLVWHKEYKYYKKAFLEEIRIKSLTRKQKEHLVTNGK
ncbi:MAG: GIY-YIG nuclease family protein [Planctomycetes bacterium]|nr:GIY-YIG nuclease family protein [Planctomycetota bacterium]